MFNLGNLFDDGDGYEAHAGLRSALQRLTEMGEAGDLSVKDFIRIAFSIMWPDLSPDSMDIRPMLGTFFASIERDDLIAKVEAAYLSQAGPILGITIGVDHDKAPLTTDDHGVVTRGIRAVLRSGGVDAQIVNGRIVITDDEGNTSDPLHVDIDVEIGKFRNEIDSELGPSHDPDNPWSRWIG